MLRATIELVPYGQEAYARTLHTLKISNIAGTPQVADYAVEYTNSDGEAVNFVLTGFERKEGAARLVLLALDDAVSRLVDARYRP